VFFGEFSESQSKDFRGTIDEADSTEDYGYSSDSDLETDEDSAGIMDMLTSMVAGTGAQQRGPPRVSGGNKIVREEYDGRTMMGKVVKIPDMAFVT
jgi:hypothetical protein